jgi:hypothetical protein
MTDSLERDGAPEGVESPLGGIRQPLLVPRHDEQEEIQPAPGSRWDGRIRTGIIVAVVLSLALAALALAPLVIERAPRRAHADTTRTPVTPLPAVFSVEAMDRATVQLDTLQLRIGAYMERRTDFLSKRIVCSQLAAGYAAADSALLRSALVVQRSRDSLPVPVLARYGRLLAAMDTVNGSFDLSGCARP